MGAAIKQEAIGSASFSHWDALLDAIAQPTTIFDRDLVFLGQNAAHEVMTGTRRADVIGRFMFDVFPPEPGPEAPNAQAAVGASVDRVWHSRQPHTLPAQQHALRQGNGAWKNHFWKITHAPIIEGDEVVAVLQTSENVTETILERWLNEAEKLAVQDATAVSFFSYEPKSQRFERPGALDDLFGFEEGEAGPLAGPFFERIVPNDLPAVVAEFCRIAGEPLGKPARFDCRVSIPGVEFQRHVRARGALVVDPADQMQKLVGVVVDMTEFEQTREQLEQAIRDKENLLIEVNHRMMNSLQLASSILRLEARDTMNETAREVLVTANARVDAIAEVHGSIYRGGDVTCAPTDMILNGVVDGLRRSVGAGDTAPEITCEADEFYLPTDLAISFGLLANELLTNALKYGGDSDAGPIEVNSAYEGNVARLSVCNDRKDHEDGQASNSTGVGSKLIDGFVRQLGGELSSTLQGNRYVTMVSFEVG